MIRANKFSKITRCCVTWVKHAVRFVSKRAAFQPLGLLTVAAMLPQTWRIRFVDMDIRRFCDADIRWADYVLIGAMIVHMQSVVEDVIPRCYNGWRRRSSAAGRYSQPAMRTMPLTSTRWWASAKN